MFGTVVLLLLLQVLSVLSTVCMTNMQVLGHCQELWTCRGPSHRILNRCANSQLYCCPLSDSGERSVNAVRAPKFPTYCGTTPMYPIRNILGGIRIEPDEFSWAASLQYGNRRSSGNCGGSVINSLYVLTAAHCVTGENILKSGGVTGVIIGDFNRTPPCDYGVASCRHYKHFPVKEIAWHPDYQADNSNELRFDIALLRLERPIHFGSKMQPICLPFGANDNLAEPEAGTMLIAAGWGYSSHGHYNPAKRAVSVPLWSKEECNQYPRDASQVCAGQYGRAVCHGDSGGPLMYQFAARRMVLEGIASYGSIPCGNMSYPDVYTNVRHYKDWIENTMRM